MPKAITIPVGVYSDSIYIAQSRSDWDEWMDGIPKVSFNFFILRYIKYHTHIYLNIYIYIYASCPHTFFVGFKFWSSWGSGYKNSKTPSRLDFFEIVLKVKKIQMISL